MLFLLHLRQIPGKLFFILMRITGEHQEIGMIVKLGQKSLQR